MEHLKEKGLSQQMRISTKQKCLHVLRKVFSQCVGEIIEAMAGYIPLPAIMAKLLSDNGSQEFGDFKLVIHRMLSMYLYEKRILVWLICLLLVGKGCNYILHLLLCGTL